MSEERHALGRNGNPPISAGDWGRIFASGDQNVKFIFDSISNKSSVLFLFFGDPRSGLYYISDNFRDTFGLSGNLVENLPKEWLSRINSSAEKELFKEDLSRAFSNKESDCEIRCVVTAQDGTVYWSRTYCSLLWNESKTEVVCLSGRIVLQDEDFVVDPTSNFLSDITFRYRVNEAASLGREYTAIGFSDNYIEHIQNIYGLAAAKKITFRICERVMTTFRNSLTLFRLPGRRAVALSRRLSQEDSLSVARAIEELVTNEYKKLGDLNKRPLTFAVMDVPQAEITSEEAEHTLISLLNLSCQHPETPVVYFNPQNTTEIKEQKDLELALSNDVRHKMRNFRIVIQPVVDSSSGEIVSGEVLMRWKYHEKDISPAKFVPILETKNLIAKAGNWVFEQAVIACKNLITLYPDFFLAVNVSIKQLNDDFITFVRKTLDKHQLKGRHIGLEITESCIDTEPLKSKALMEGLEELGVRFALDDCGTGYSSLRVLMEYPTDVIKFDRSLLLAMEESRSNERFINTMIFGCHQCGKDVCIEGVETEAQDALAKAADCDLIQGYLYHRPMELPDVIQLFQEKFG